MSEAPRPRAVRRRDTERRLAVDADCWVASAAPDGVPHLVPLSFDWDGEALLLATDPASPTARNLAASSVVRLALGGTRDVTLVDGTVEILALTDLAGDVCDRFAARSGWDPRAEPTAHVWLRVVPRRVLAWREAEELAGRELMRDGAWLA